MPYHALMYLTYEQMVARVRQLQKKKWARQLINEMHTRLDGSWTYCARELARQLSMEDLCVRVG